MNDVALVFPPLWNPLHPYLGMSVLYRYLKDKGLTVSQHDVNIDFFTLAFSEGWLSGKIAVFEARAEALEAQEQLDGEQQMAYIRAKATAAGLTKVLAATERIIPDFKDEDYFYDLDSYLSLHEKVDEALGFLGRAYQLKRLTADTYESAFRQSASGDIIAATRAPERREKNLFYDFFSDNLVDDIVTRQNPRLVGISLMDGSQIIAAFTLARLFKEKLPEWKVGMGGAMATKWINRFEVCPALFSDVDYFVAHEGTEPLRQLALSLKEGREPEGIPNLYFMRQGKLVTPATLHGYESQNLTPDFEGLDLNKYWVTRNVLPLKATNGCSHGICTFCEHPFLANQEAFGYQASDPVELVARMKALSDKYDCHHFAFIDSCISFPFADKFCDEMIARGYDFKWHGFLRLEPRLNKEFARKLYQAGCRKIYSGYESASLRVLKLMKKRKTSSHLPEILGNLNEVGISLGFFVMYGFPGEEAEDVQQTFDEVNDLAPLLSMPGLTFDYIPFYYVDHCPIGEDPEAFGLRPLEKEGEDLRENTSFEFLDPAMRRNDAEYEALYQELMEAYAQLFRGLPFIGMEDRTAIQVHDAMNLLYLDRHGRDIPDLSEVDRKRYLKKGWFKKEVNKTHISLASGVVALKSPFDFNALSLSARGGLMAPIGKEEGVQYALYNCEEDHYVTISRHLYEKLATLRITDHIGSEALVAPSLGKDFAEEMSRLNELITEDYIYSME